MSDTTFSETRTTDLLRKGLILEYITLFWNVAGVAVTAVAAFRAQSIAIGGFGLDSFIEIGASLIVVKELKRTDNHTHSNSLMLIGSGFYLIALYIFLQTIYLLLNNVHPQVSSVGIGWTALSFLTMLALARGKSTLGSKLKNPILITEGKVTVVDAYLAASIMIGLLLNAIFGLWWADPVSALIIVYYGIKEGRAAFTEAQD